MRRTWCASLLVLSVSSTTWAQSAPPLPPPSAAQPAPQGGYAPPPPQYYGPQQPGYPPPSYAYAQPPASGPEEVDAEEGRPPPPGYHAETRYRKGLVITGPIVLGVPYLFSLSAATTSNTTGDGWLAVPVLGPFIDLSVRKKDVCATSDTLSCAGDSGTRAVLVFDGLMQATGAALLIIGLATPRHLWVQNFTGENGATHFAFTFAPMRFEHQGSGAGIVGMF